MEGSKGQASEDNGASMARVADRDERRKWCLSLPRVGAETPR